MRPDGPAQAYARRVRRLPGITGAHETAARAAAADPALAQGQVSTPAGGAYEWQYYATHVDRVPADVLAAARGITIAVVDTGADAASPALAGKIVGRYDVRTGRPAAGDASGHGTFVASLAAGTSVASGGVAGFGGAARLLVVKVSDSTTFDDVDVAAGIVYAVRHGARIVNLSVAGRSPSYVERSALLYAARRGVLVVAAAGNDALDGNPTEYPAAYLQPLGSNGLGGSGLVVGASDMAGKRAAFSAYGSFVSLAAPGATVFGMLPARTTSGLFSRQTLAGATGGSYAYASGTSFAAPEVAGAAALVWAANPTLTAPEVASILKETASGGGAWNPELGFGVIDVAAAVDRARAAAAAS